MKKPNKLREILEKLYRLGRSEYMENLRSINLNQAETQIQEHFEKLEKAYIRLIVTLTITVFVLICLVLYIAK